MALDFSALATKATGDLASGLGKGLGQAIGGGGGPFTGGSATAGAYGVPFSKDGWTLNFGSGSQSATSSQERRSVDAAAAGLPQPLQAQQAGMPSWVLIGALGLLAVKLAGKRGA